MTMNTVRPPQLTEEVFCLERRISPDHRLHIGEMVPKKNAHPQFTAGWNAFYRQVGDDRSKALLMSAPKGFHPQFISGWEMARGLTLHMTAAPGPLTVDTAREAILEWRKRKNALHLS
jgi:hypothetical protein